MSVIMVASKSVIAQSIETMKGLIHPRVTNPQIKVGFSPRDIAINEDTNKIYVWSPTNGIVSVIDGNSGAVKNVTVVIPPCQLSTSMGQRSVQHVSLETFLEPVVGAITVDPSFNKIYLFCYSVVSTIYYRDGITMSICYIKVGKDPKFILVNPDSRGNSKIYVANLSDELANQIPMWDLSSMLVSHYGNGSRIYVASAPLSFPGGSRSEDFPPSLLRENGTVSVINPIQYKRSYNKNEQNITVGPGPNEMVDGLLSKIYVSNRGYPGYHGSNNQTISVIDVSGHYGIPDKKEPHDIIVGQNPGPMAFNAETHMIYVGNTGSGTVSVINGFSSKVAAGVRFAVKPVDSGRIMCDNQSGTNQSEYPTNVYIYVDNGTRCTGQGNTNFVFDRWVQNLNRNSSLSVGAPSGYLTIDRYGNFTANFKALPPAIPPEYWTLIITLILTSVIGWSIPSIFGWVKAKGQRTHLEELIKMIDDDGGKSHKDAIEEKIIGYYVKGKLSEDHRQMLKDKISEYYGSVKGSESGD